MLAQWTDLLNTRFGLMVAILNGGERYKGRLIQAVLGKEIGALTGKNVPHILDVIRRASESDE
jgi:hypothetical protein